MQSPISWLSIYVVLIDIDSRGALCGPTLVHKRRNSSDSEVSLAIYRTTLLLE